MEQKNTYWKGLEELNQEPEFVKNASREFPEDLPIEEVLNEQDMDLKSNRRDFLKFFGFSISAVTLAACNKAPVKNAIPYIVKPEEITPGVPNYYASTFGRNSVVVKTREGRPIKVDGNDRSSLVKGGLDASGQASVFSLYDNERLTDPLKNGEKVSWATVDAEVKKQLEAVSASGGKIAIVANTIISPSTLKLIDSFKETYPTAELVTYDPVGYSGITKANERSFGKAVIPNYNFDKAEVIVSFGADFLGTWLSPVQFTKAYMANRVPTKDSPKMSKHIQFEALLSITGSNADSRVPLKASSEGKALISLYNHIASLTGATPLRNAGSFDVSGNAIKNAAKELEKTKGKSLVISGSNDPAIQSLVNQINLLLGNYGTTVDLDNYMAKANNATDFDKAIKGLGSNDAIIFYNTNPVYTHPKGAKLAEQIKKMKLAVSTAYNLDETADVVQYVTPDLHFLESWDDSEVQLGKYSFTQPTIAPIFNTRQAQESLAKWSGISTAADGTFSYYDYIRTNWRENVYPNISGFASFDDMWNRCLHDGIFEMPAAASTTPSANILANDLLSAIDQKGNDKGMDLVLYQKVGLKDGSDANNPWLHEVPDPITKVCWDNYVSLPKYTADKLGVKDGDYVTVSANGYTIDQIPALIQPGQVRDTIAIAIGYGRTKAGKVGNYVGKNAYPFVKEVNGTASHVITGVTVTKASGNYEFARTQTHNSIEGRDIVREATLKEYQKNPGVRNEDHLGGMRDKNGDLITLWEEHDYTTGHHWAQAIDLNACTGCGACIVSCSVENNVPVVGRDEVRRRREMHWIRIDRYYSFEKKEGGYTTKEDEYAEMEDYENVKVVHQPMMCQHCDHAPCETVCPVLATTHSSEGLNQMTYNRCIGTKYCANNCPYKVRRFNWFRYNDNDDYDYHFNNDLGKMVINPDVTVRTRGVMEKCSMCVQRIQAGKLKAKIENRKLEDGEFTTACAQTCPSNAIVFGDLNDSNSEIAKLYRNERSYHVLEELNVQPSVVYMTKIRNTDQKDA